MTNQKPSSSIFKKFNQLKADNKKAFIPYIMAGDPNLEETIQRAKLLQDYGADIIELGVPFSDPLADGPTIQSAAERSLANGTTLRKLLSFLRHHRKDILVPIVLMTYYNPIFKMGEDVFLQEAHDIGVDGLIVPDLTAEESYGFVEKASSLGIDTIFLIAPNSTKERIGLISKLTSGFVYYVSITGITGSALNLPQHFNNHISIIREATTLPICVGFGISKPSDAKFISQFVDGVIVGSAIVKRFHEDPFGVKFYLKELKEAIGG